MGMVIFAMGLVESHVIFNVTTAEVSFVIIIQKTLNDLLIFFILNVSFYLLIDVVEYVIDLSILIIYF